MPLSTSKRYTSGLGILVSERIRNLARWLLAILLPFSKMPKQLCTAAQFRQKIAGGDGSESLSEVNLKTYGIPQGSPISDLLANVYLLEFDKSVRARVDALLGSYFRYSDDILIVCPGGEDTGKALVEEVRQMIKKFGRSSSSRKRSHPSLSSRLTEKSRHASWCKALKERMDLNILV